jgi:uncharacterized protein YegL
MDNDNTSGMTTFGAGNFAFSAASLDTLESSEYTLCVICIDKSLSISGFATDMENALKNVVEACSKSPRSDNLMLRIVTFDREVNEFHGFKELNKCHLGDYDNMLTKLGGATTLYDAMVNGLESLNKYSEELNASDYSVNGLAVFISDGLDNYSTGTPSMIKSTLKDVVGENKLESLVGILVGVNTSDTSIERGLRKLAGEVGLEFVDIKDANAKSLAKLAQFISKSITSQSKSLGTGIAPQSIKF